MSDAGAWELDEFNHAAGGNQCCRWVMRFEVSCFFSFFPVFVAVLGHDDCDDYCTLLRHKTAMCQLHVFRMCSSCSSSVGCRAEAR